MFTLLFIFLISLLVFYNFVWKRRNLPPGPMPLPLIGNGLTLKRFSPGYEAFSQWTKQYGPVFTFWIAEDPVVAITDFKLMKQTFVNDGEAYNGRDFFDKIFAAIEETKSGYGEARGKSELWSQLRRFSLKVFRNLGMGRNLMEQKVMVEVDTIIETINNDLCNTTKLKNKPLHLFPLIDVAIGSIINQIVFGYRFIGETRKEFYELKAVMDEQTHMFTHPICVVLFAMPCLRYLPVFSHYFNRVKQRVGRLYQFFDGQIEKTMQRRRKEAEKSSFKEDDTYFVDAFLHEIEIRKSLSGNTDEEDKLFNHESLRGLCHDLFNAGQETTANTLNFVILYMIVYPEKQTKMQEELDRIMGDNEGGTRRVSLADKSKLPYTNAVINETQRFCNLVPLNLIHRTTKDVECAGFKLPKGTRITPMISTVLYDQKIFPKPQAFIPERFLEDGQLKKCEEFIPFSIGKRQCMGESLARMELFLFTANLFYLYKISAVDQANPPSLNKTSGLVVAPEHYECLVEKR